jgi:hypothetical protein
MPQKSVPISDAFPGGWQPIPIWSQINQLLTNDPDHVTSSSTISPDSFTVNLTTMAVPGSGSTRTLYVRLKNTTSTLIKATVVLLDGGVIIAAWAGIIPPTSFETYPLPLTFTQVLSITNFDLLQVEVMAGDVTTTCCPSNPIPTFLNVTVTNGSLCNGTYPVIYTGGAPNFATWLAQGKIGSCGASGSSYNVWLLSCVNGGWTIVTGTLSPHSPSSSSCDPFIITFTGVNLTGCGGTSNATVTVTPPPP